MRLKMKPWWIGWLAFVIAVTLLAIMDTYSV